MGQVNKQTLNLQKHQEGTCTDQSKIVRAAARPPSSFEGAVKSTTIFTVLEPKFDHFLENGASENRLKNHRHDFFSTWIFFLGHMKNRSLR